MRMRVLGENWELRMRVLKGINEIETENETPNFQEWGFYWNLKCHFYDSVFILGPLSLKNQNCSEMLEKLPLKSTKFNLDVSNFWEFENESWEWEWEFSQQNWESRLRMRWEFSLRVSISRSRWESRRSLWPHQPWPFDFFWLLYCKLWFLAEVLIVL